MSALDEVRQAIINKFNSSGFYSTFPGMKIQLPNQAFVTPTDATYVKLSIMHGDSDPAQITNTNQVDRNVGILQFDVITPLDKGTIVQNNVSDYLGKIFRRAYLPTPSAGTIIFRTPDYINVGEDRGAIRLVVRIPFKRDEVFRS